MNEEALLKICEILQEVLDKNFSLKVWRCGTAGCAIGHAASHPWFIERGLTMSDNHGISSTHGNYIQPEFNNGEDVFTDFTAVSEFFDISYDDACFLFGGNYYSQKNVTKQDVIDRIQKYVADPEMSEK